MQNSFLLGKNKELLSRCFFTLAMLLVCRIGSFVPIAGVDSTSLNELVNRNQDGILGMFNLLSGGSLARMSVFALAIMPYITASIIIQLLSVVYQPLEKLKKDGEIGKQQINQITRCLTVFLAALQAFGVAMSLEKMTTTVGPVVIIPGLFFKLTTVLTLVVGTMFLMWVGEQISAKGIGNGSSLIIFVGIVSGIPNAIITSLKLSRSGELSGLLVLLILIFLLFLVACIIFFEKAQRRVVVQYPKRQIGNKIYGGDTTHLPLKLNTAGVIPPIFASSILLFPLTIANLSSNSDSRILNWISNYLGHGKPLFVVLYAFLIVFFAIFYTAIVFNTEDTANNLKKYNAYIPGVRPGKNTAEYFDHLLIKLSSIGAIYLCFICIVPEILVNKFAAAFTLGGTSLLIVVNVVLDTFATVQTYMFTSRYDVLIKKMKNKR